MGQRFDRTPGMDFELTDEVAEQLNGIASTVRHVGRQAQMVGAAGEDATTAVLPDEQELRNHLLTGMSRRQAIPPGEAADAEQLDAIVQDVGSAHPRHLVSNRL